MAISVSLPRTRTLTHLPHSPTEAGKTWGSEHGIPHGGEFVKGGQPPYRPEPGAPEEGEMEMEDTPLGPSAVRWHRQHESLVLDALHSWKGSPSSMRGHMRWELDGEPLPSSKSGMEMRSQAGALLWELTHNAKGIGRRLYRGVTTKRLPKVGQTLDFKIPSGFSSNLRTARKFAGVGEKHSPEGFRVLYVVEPGSRGLRIKDYLGKSSSSDLSEQEYIEGGKYRVVDVTPAGDHFMVRLQQQLTPTEALSPLPEAAKGEVDPNKAEKEALLALARKHYRDYALSKNDEKFESRLASAFDTPPRVLYHGTTARLKPGDLLRGPAETGAETNEGRPPSAPDQPNDFWRPDRVYLSDKPWLAGRYGYGRSRRLGGEAHVYEIEPLGLAHRDPEYLTTGLGSDQWVAPMGRVVREVDPSEWADPRLAPNVNRTPNAAQGEVSVPKEKIPTPKNMEDLSNHIEKYHGIFQPKAARKVLADKAETHRRFHESGIITRPHTHESPAQIARALQQAAKAYLAMEKHPSDLRAPEKAQAALQKYMALTGLSAAEAVQQVAEEVGRLESRSDRPSAPRVTVSLPKQRASGDVGHLEHSPTAAGRTWGSVAGIPHGGEFVKGDQPPNASQATISLPTQTQRPLPTIRIAKTAGGAAESTRLWRNDPRFLKEPKPGPEYEPGGRARQRERAEFLRAAQNAWLTAKERLDKKEDRNDTWNAVHREALRQEQMGNKARRGSNGNPMYGPATDRKVARLLGTAYGLLLANHQDYDHKGQSPESVFAGWAEAQGDLGDFHSNYWQSRIRDAVPNRSGVYLQNMAKVRPVFLRYIAEKNGVEVIAIGTGSVGSLDYGPGLYAEGGGRETGNSVTVGVYDSFRHLIGLTVGIPRHVLWSDLVLRRPEAGAHELGHAVDAQGRFYTRARFRQIYDEINLLEVDPHSASDIKEVFAQAFACYNLGAWSSLFLLPSTAGAKRAIKDLTAFFAEIEQELIAKEGTS